VVAALFLTANGLLLYGVEKLRSRSTAGAHRMGVHATTTATQKDPEGGAAADDRLARRGWGEAIGIGAAQILALLPGFSRSGATIAAGLVLGLDHEDAARFAFLLATPVILAAGLLKLPELAGPEGNGILGQVFVGSVVAGVAA
jgi:undecaprenyl-diphosphatase